MSIEKRIFYSICLISFVGPFLSTSITIAIPAMAGEFQVTPDQLSWVITIFLMMTAACLLPLGKVSDVHGRRHTYAISLLVFAVSTAAAAAAPTLLVLIILRAIQGIALAGVYVSYMPLLLVTTDEAHQGHVLGRAVALTYLGQTLGPVIGGALTEFAGWRCIFALSALAIVASYLFIRPIDKEWYANGAPFVNIVSSLLSSSAIVLTLYGLSSITENHYALLAGLIILIIFIIHEGKSFHPLLPLYLFRNRIFSLSNLAALIQYSSTYAVSFLLSLYFQLILGLSPALSGAILLVQPVIMAFLSPRAGDLSDKYGSFGIASIGLLLTACGLTAFALVPALTISSSILFLLLMGLGSALFGAPNNSAIMGSVKTMYHGIASSILALSRNLGQALSMVIITYIMSSEINRHQAYADSISAALHVSFCILAALCFLAVAASLARLRSSHTA